jgi:hypothetical protein
MTKLRLEKLDMQSWLRGEYITYGGIIWSIISAVLYLNFSVVDAHHARPIWFILATTGLEELGLLIAGYLCWRNWHSPAVPTGRAVWLLFAIAILPSLGGIYGFVCGKCNGA